MPRRFSAFGNFRFRRNSVDVIPEIAEASVSSEKFSSYANAPRIEISLHGDPEKEKGPDSTASFGLSDGPTSSKPSSQTATSVDFSRRGTLQAPPRLRRKWKSSRLRPGELDEKPWTGVPIPHRNWERYIFWGGVLAGSILGAYLIWDAYSNVTNSQYCLVFNDTFIDINDDIWSYEIQRGGFGSGSFEWTTTDPENIYTDDSGLHIVPTLTINTTNITESQLLNGYNLNLTTTGQCTSTQVSDCGVQSNTTSGAIINPVRSARINTKGKASIKYGKVEVRAKMPKGDWLWPAIWMMPVDDVYGVWPQSGEIDITEVRGNDVSYVDGGRDIMTSTLHWGPNSALDGYWRTQGQYQIKRTDFTVDFHTYGLEWSEKYLFFYLDSRLLQIFFIKWNKGTTMWSKGEFGTADNQSALTDPWTSTGRPNTPFDQEFYLILNVAVGGTNGFFYDGVGNKPWINGNNDAQRAFWLGRSQWESTWPDDDTRGMTVANAAMWSLGACNATSS